MKLHFPVFMPVKSTDEFMLVKVNDEMTDCLPVFTSRELAELYVSQEGSGMNLFVIDEPSKLSQFIRGMTATHSVKNYAINFTFQATAVTCGPVLELLEND